MRSDFEESATKGRDISGNMLQHISCSVKSLIIEVALIIYLNVITIANNFKKWQRINCNYEQMLFFISLFEICNYVFFQRINGQLWLTARKRERETA